MLNNFINKGIIEEQIDLCSLVIIIEMSSKDV